MHVYVNACACAFTCVRACVRVHVRREARLAELLEAQRRVAAPFEPLNEKHEPLMDRKAREDLQASPVIQPNSRPQLIATAKERR